jgi:hypothetical protein
MPVDPSARARNAQAPPAVQAPPASKDSPKFRANEILARLQRQRAKDSRDAFKKLEKERDALKTELVVVDLGIHARAWIVEEEHAALNSEVARLKEVERSSNIILDAQHLILADNAIREPIDKRRRMDAKARDVAHMNDHEASASAAHKMARSLKKGRKALRAEYLKLATSYKECQADNILLAADNARHKADIVTLSSSVVKMKSIVQQMGSAMEADASDTNLSSESDSDEIELSDSD